MVDPVPLPAVDLGAAAAFISAITGNPDGYSAVVTFQSFDDVEFPPGPDGKKKHRGDQNLARTFHGTLAGCAPTLVAMNEAGAGVFLTINETDLRGRTAANVVGLRALFVDSDTGPLAFEPPLAPSIRVRTVQGEHAYWLLQPGEPRDDFGPSQKALIAFYGTDKSIHDLPRVMRLPGFLHRKGAPTPLVAWYGDVTRRFTIPEIMRAHPKLRILPKPAQGGGFEAVAGAFVPTPHEGVATRNPYQTLKPRKTMRDKFEEALAHLTVAQKERNNYLFKVARLGRDLLQIGGSTPLEIRTRLVEACTANGLIAEEHDKTLATIERALAEDDSWQTRMICDDHGAPKPVLGNAVMFLENDPDWAGTLWLNTRAQEITFVQEPPLMFSGVVPVIPRAVQDADYGHIATWFTTHRKMPINDRIASVAALSVASMHVFDPVVDYLNRVGDRWDGVERLPTVLKRYAGAKGPDEYLDFAFRRWAVGCVARAMSPGSQMDITLILEGDQGSGKTSFFRVLSSVAPGAFGERPPRDINGKPMQEFIRGPWIIEFSELSTFRKNEIEDVKAFLTLLNDRYRPAYGRTVATYPRSCAFCGTANGGPERPYLRDTENRRFLPVATGLIDLDALTRDRDQIWAEAVCLYDDGEQWHLTAEENEIARVEQDRRFEIDALEPAIIHAVTHGVRADSFTIGPSIVGAGLQQWGIPPNAQSVSVREILEHVCKDRGERNTNLQTRITTVLSGRMGWTAGIGPSGERRYFRPLG